jgi:hypothetical protein
MIVAAGLLGLAAVGVAGGRFAARALGTQERVTGAALAFAAQSIPATAVGRAHVETRPTLSGWMVILHDANVDCGDAAWCRQEALPPSAPSAPVFRDVVVCVDYATGQVFSVFGFVHTIGLFQNGVCAASKAAPRTP